MRVAFVLSGLGAGGAEKIISLLAQHRAELGDEVHVLAYAAVGEGSYFPQHPSVAIRVPNGRGTPSGSSALRFVRRLTWLRQQVRAIRPDLVVSFLTKANVLVMMATQGLGIPVVLSERNNPKMQDAHYLWRVASSILAARASGLVMQTEAARQSLPQTLRRSAVVIPNPCVLPAGARPSDRQGHRVLAVGRLERQKGFDLLIKAFARVASRAPRATLTVYGEGSLRSALQQQALALGIDDRVTFPGVSEAPGAWLSDGDIFVLSSRFEGFPNVLVEALAGGMAAVAFDCPWGPAAIVSNENNGILVPPEDVEGLANALERLLNDRDLRQSLARSAPKSVERFELGSVLAQWDDVLWRAAGRPNAAVRPSRRASSQGDFGS